MRHVTDGELHSFLDGGLDLLPDDRGDAVRDHISSCPACQERLQDEEHIRSEAKGILGDPTFDQVTLPSFEELRERAAAPGVEDLSPRKSADGGSHYRGPLRGLPLAWAATIVLALGVGWMGGQVGSTFLPRALPGLEDSSYDLVEQSGAQLADMERESGETDGPQPSRADLAAGSGRDQALQEGENRAIGEVVSTASPQEGAQELQRRQAAVEPETAPVSLEAIPPGSELALSEKVETLLADSTAAEGTLNALNPTVVTASRRRAALPSMAFQAAGTGGTPDSLQVSFDTVERSDSLENSLAIPGLKVVSIEWEERVAGEKALLIRQLLSPGDTLELRYFGMLLGVDPEPKALREGGVPGEETASGRAYANVLEASLPLGWNQVVMEWGRGLLVARGPIAEENLKALLKYLH